MDHFGNLITNIHRETLEAFRGEKPVTIRVGVLVMRGLRKHYAEAEEGEVLCLIGSDGRLEIAVNLGRACDLPGLGSGNPLGLPVELERSLK